MMIGGATKAAMVNIARCTSCRQVSLANVIAHCHPNDVERNPDVRSLPRSPARGSSCAGS
jgi:hypothetical protein